MYYAFFAPDVPAPNRANRYLYFIRVDRFLEEAYDDAVHYDWTQRGPEALGRPDEPAVRAPLLSALACCGRERLGARRTGFRDYEALLACDGRRS